MTTRRLEAIMDSAIILFYPQATVDVGVGHYRVPVRCFNCDTELYAILPNGTMADAVRREKCIRCECVGELRKVGPRS